MFSNIGWGEIFVIVVLGVIIIGPERLPGVIEDVRAAIFAARKAINNAKAELNGELGEMGQEFEALRGPISTAAEWGRMGPRAAITKALFDGDETALDDFNIRKSAGEALGSRQQHASQVTPVEKPRASFDYSQVYQPEQTAQPQQIEQPAPKPKGGNYASGGGFSWADIT